MSAQQALERLHDCREVESAYREQTRIALDAYNAAVRQDPHSAESDRCATLRREALGQWKKARADLAAAEQVWKGLYARTWAQGRGVLL